MRDPPLVSGIFDATDIASMTAAFDAAMLIACDDGSPFLPIPERDLRAWIARRILTGMRHGDRDTHRLAALALRDLHHLLPPGGGAIPESGAIDYGDGAA